MSRVEIVVVLLRVFALATFVGATIMLAHAIRIPSRRPVVTRMRLALAVFFVGQVITHGVTALLWGVNLLDDTPISITPVTLPLATIAALSGAVAIWALWPRRP